MSLTQTHFDPSLRPAPFISCCSMSDKQCCSHATHHAVKSTAWSKCSSLLVTAQNKCQNIRRYLVSTVERLQYTPFFKFKSIDVKLLSCLDCLSDKNGRFGVMIDQISCQSNSLLKGQIAINFNNTKCPEKINI